MDEKVMRKIEHDVMSGLKNFQRATVERIDKLFRENRNRVLVADEVGLGKTLIARGCIAKTGLLCAEEHGELFKVVYVCSNQNIARKNIRKLDVYNVGGFDNLSDNRLSMQHLQIVEQEINSTEANRDAQLIPLTPYTSFRMTSGKGTVNERALMFAIFCRMPQFSKHIESLERNLSKGAVKGWYQWAKDYYGGRVATAEQKTQQTANPYPETLINDINKNFPELIQNVIDCLEANKEFDTSLINGMRMMFAQISVERLKPDLVIMDEFQRFKFLLSEENSEMGMITRKFLSSDSTRVLLLSATPYKLYNTIEEMEEISCDNHYKEFMQVMHFLFNKEEEKDRFDRVWSEYSEMLQVIKKYDIQLIKQEKDKAENELYRGMCRTERISVMDGEDFIDSGSAKHPLDINPLEILSYVEGCQLVENALGRNSKIPMDYAKSCPFLLSFMNNYVLMDRLRAHFENHQEDLPERRGLLWVDTSKIYDYKPLPETNARLALLKKHMFEQYKSHLYLWVPPSMPYYPLEGVYRDSRGFSKILLFSAWEMVPRMIGSLISYEAERLTVGEISHNASRKDRKNTHYYSEDKRRYPYRRLQGGSERFLLYPSKTLAGLYSPVSCLNRKMNLDEIKRRVAEMVADKLPEAGQFSGNTDNRWYLVAPMIMDGLEYAKEWARNYENPGYKTKSDILISELMKEGGGFNDLKMGAMPGNLVEVLSLMAIGSPAVCIYRGNGGNAQNAANLAKVFVNRFNTTEATAVVQLAYPENNSNNPHWINVLNYCVDGCFQAMFDEYHHMLMEDVQFCADEDKEQKIFEKMYGYDGKNGTISLHSATYSVETLGSFRRKVKKKLHAENRFNHMRAHFAVGFVNNKRDNDKLVNRKENIQDAFNSPMRPFVLASTSIGQEGLDFHNYCRKIMHWNLPGNPVDFEQREGRVNRFKCLAIRQSLAEQYGQDCFENDVWKEIFDKACTDMLKNGESELIPFWCLGKMQNFKIERIVPMYPLSQDQLHYQRLIKILSLYRMTMGQARQEELLQYIFQNFSNTESLKELFINLSPFSKEGSNNK